MHLQKFILGSYASRLVSFCLLVAFFTVPVFSSKRQRSDTHDEQWNVLTVQERSANSGTPTNYTCRTANDCFNFPGRPVCYLNPNGTQACVPCNPAEDTQPHIDAPPWALQMKDCYCSPDEYCISDHRDDHVGFCRRYSEDYHNNGQRILGSSCVTSLQGQGMSTVSGVNDFMFCGKVNYDGHGAALWKEWEGSCQLGICFKCGQTPVPSLPIAQCQDGRSCVKSSMEYAAAGILSWAYWADNAVISFAGLLSLMIFFCMSVVALLFLCLLIRKVCCRPANPNGVRTSKASKSGHERCAVETDRHLQYLSDQIGEAVDSALDDYTPLMYEPEELTSYAPHHVGTEEEF